METILELTFAGIIFKIIVGIICIVLLWLFIKSAVKAGVKQAIQETILYGQPQQGGAMRYQTPEELQEEIRKEQEGWK